MGGSTEAEGLMYPASLGFINALRWGSQLAGVQLTLFVDGVATQYIVPMSSADITIDRLAAQRRQGTITIELIPSIPPPVLLPSDDEALLAPFGNEVYLQYGLETSEGVKDLVPLGLFVLATTTVDYATTNLTITFDVYDRSWVISQRAFKQPYSFPMVGGNFVAEIQHLLDQVWAANQPPLTYNITPTTSTVPAASYDQGSDPWQAAQDMANACGYELFPDINGVFVGYPTPNPADLTVVWQFVDGSLTAASGTGGHTGTGSSLGSSPYTTPTSIVVTFTRDRVFNDFIITGSGSGVANPILAEAADTSGTSLSITGPLGDVPSFVQSNLITSSVQAQVAAETDLRQSLSQAWQISVATTPNPLFDIDDLVNVNQPWLGLNENIWVDNIQHVVRYDAVTTVTGRAWAC